MYLMREMEGKPLNLPTDNFDGGQKDKKNDKNKSKTDSKEKRRRSLLPWRQSEYYKGEIIHELLYFIFSFHSSYIWLENNLKHHIEGGKIDLKYYIIWDRKKV